jgi:hypothetical protein
MPVGDYDASPISSMILKYAINWDTVSRKRCKNFAVLLGELSDLALFKELPGDVVPLGFPIVHNKRDQLLQTMFNNKIYPPVHWTLSDDIPDCYIESHLLSRKIITLLCDQRYNESDMFRIIEIIKKEL